MFDVSPPSADIMDTFWAHTGGGRLSSEFELSLLAILGALSAGCGTLMS